jgi:hypothetical protein
MAEQNGPAPKPASTGQTPAGTLTLAFVLWVLGCAAAAAAVIVLEQQAQRNPDQPLPIAIEYVAFAPATLLVLGAIAALIIGSIRLALYGKDGKGLKLPAASAQLTAMEVIQQRLMVSETAKKVAYRVEDIKLLRQSIEQDIQRKEFDAAMVLVKLLADTYGRLEESEQYRERIDAARNAEQEQRIGHEVARLDELLNRNDFPKAVKQASRIKRLFPNVESVQSIDQLVVQARDQHKHDLEREFLEAAQRDDVVVAMAKLKELDQYLSPKEAEPFREVARGVIGKQRENLGVQFKLAWKDKEWLTAVRIGEQIIREFPNTRMADEVRGAIDIARQNAEQQRKAGASA